MKPLSTWQYYTWAGAIVLACVGLVLLAPTKPPKSTQPAVTVATATPPPAVAPSVPAIAAAPQPIWADEFGGPAGRAVSSAKWNQDVGGGGWGNDEWEYYTGLTSNAALDGAGHLIITARRPAHPAGSCATGPCDITSARLQTDGLFATTYGRFEARLKTPAGRGLWPAFWMLSSDDRGELDIMENNGRDPHIISGTLHIPGYTPTGGLSTDYVLPGSSAADAFHLYALNWTPSQIIWSVDGRAFQTIKKSDIGASHWVFDRPFYLLLNLAVGSADPGYPDATTPFPAQLVVDYVRVYKTAQ